MNILIVEDEELIAESLEELLEILGHEVCAIAPTTEEALLKLKECEADLVLLDIQLQGKVDGIQLSGMIREQYHIPYIFTTAFADDDTIALAKKQSPFGYLVKPYGLNDLKAAIEVACINFEKLWELEHSQHQENATLPGHIFVKSESKLVKINLADLGFVEAHGDYMVFHTKDKNHIVHTTMKNLEEKLSDSRFFKCHRSFLINMEMIEDVDETTLVVLRKTIPISRKARPELLQKINTL